MIPTIGKVRVCAGNQFYDYLMLLLWFRVFPASDFHTVLVSVSIRLRGKARLGKQLDCESENHINKT